MVTFFVLILLLCHLCAKSWPFVQLRPSSASWTHFVYIIGDNNLDSAAVTDLEEMRENTATNQDDLNLVVYVDRFAESQISVSNIYNCDTMTPISGRFDGSKILQKSGAMWCEIYDFPEELDSTQSEIITNFTGLMSQFELTSTYFILEFWDHGGAWSGFGNDENTAGLQTPNSLNYFVNAIRNGLEMTHLGRLDILGFDACMMADYSELYYISKYDLTKYYIASEVSEPSEGWDYLNGLNTKSANNPIEYATYIIDAYVNQKESTYTLQSGAGYTLALFDMDYVGIFLSEFDTLMQMMTLAVHNYDYGMLMAILRAQSSTLYVDEHFLMIEDLGLFLLNLVNEENIFFNSCNERLQTSGKNTLQYLKDSVIYFNADFVRKDTMTGSTIFWSTNGMVINDYLSRVPNLSSLHYATFLTSLSSIVSNLAYHDQTYTFSNISCSTPIPNDFSFSVSDEKTIEYSSDYEIYRISTNVVSTVMSAVTSLFYPLSTTLSIVIAELETNIVDYDFHNTSSVTYWDGNLVWFADINNDSNHMFGTGVISYTYDSKASIPKGYIAKYPVTIYDVNSTFSGYIQFEVVLGIDLEDTPTDLQLYKYTSDDMIEPVPSTADVTVEAIYDVIINDTMIPFANGAIYLPYLAKHMSFYPFSAATIRVIEFDIFGNLDSLSFDIMTNFSYQNIPIITTTKPTTTGKATSTESTSVESTSVESTTVESTTVESTTVESTTTTTFIPYIKKSSADTRTGLDAVSGVVWLSIAIVLFVMNLFTIWLVIFCYIKRKGKAMISLIEVKDHEVGIEMGGTELLTETAQ